MNEIPLEFIQQKDIYNQILTKFVGEPMKPSQRAPRAPLPLRLIGWIAAWMFRKRLKLQLLKTSYSYQTTLNIVLCVVVGISCNLWFTQKVHANEKISIRRSYNILFSWERHFVMWVLEIQSILATKKKKSKIHFILFWKLRWSHESLDLYELSIECTKYFRRLLCTFHPQHRSPLTSK